MSSRISIKFDDKPVYIVHVCYHAGCTMDPHSDSVRAAVTSDDGAVTSDGGDVVQKALDYVFQLRGGDCVGGTGDVLPLQFDVDVWNQYTDPAIR